MKTRGVNDPKLTHNNERAIITSDTHKHFTSINVLIYWTHSLEIEVFVMEDRKVTRETYTLNNTTVMGKKYVCKDGIERFYSVDQADVNT